MKRAAIYIRVSTEKQAEKVSPDAQEADTREYCKQKGYQVVEVYRDIEKYRAGGRMVEPSGTRSDRPQFKRMIADADSRQFEVLVAWREDRLYRNINRALLELSERVSQKIIEVELVKEHYDPTTAPIKAWAAGVELQAKHDRLMMGVSGRLKQGKTWLVNTPYGYSQNDGRLSVNEEEAQWVRFIWESYGTGWTLNDIRKELIEAGAKQRTAGHAWGKKNLYKILNYGSFATGIILTDWDGETYETPMPVIVDAEMAARVHERQACFKEWPMGNIRTLSLGAGLVLCQHHGMHMRLVHRTFKGRDYLYYRCNRLNNIPEHEPGCAGWSSGKRIDAEIWRKVWGLVSEPGAFEEAIEKRVQVLQAEEVNAEAECHKLEGQLTELEFERQKVVTWARKKIIKEKDLEIQIGMLDMQEAEIKRSLADVRLLVGNRAEKLTKIAEVFRETVRIGYEAISKDPGDSDEGGLIFKARRKIIEGLVVRVDVLPDKSIKVYTEIDLSISQPSAG